MTNSIENTMNEAMQEQQTFQLTGKPEAEKKPAKKSGSKKSANKNPGIPKVKAEIVDEATIKAQKEKEAAKRALALKSLDSLTGDIFKEIETVKKSFCKVGFFLWKIRDNGLYAEREFKNVYDYAESVFGFKKSSTGSYINVCERFSKRDAKGNPTRELKEEFKRFSYTQLTEALALPEEKLSEVNPDMTVSEIRKLKKEASAGEKQESPVDGSVSSGSFGTPTAPPISLWERVLTEENFGTLLKLLKASIGKEISVYVEQDAPVQEKEAASNV